MANKPNGICIRCGEPSMGVSKPYCHDCQASIVSAYNARKKAGIRMRAPKQPKGAFCIVCGVNPRRGSSSYCAPCYREKAKSRKDLSFTPIDETPSCIKRGIDISKPVCKRSGIDTHFGHVSNKTFLPEYKTWCNMKRRCYYPATNAFKHYGGRGIRVCDRWLNSFDAFYLDMGPKPGEHYSIDRINKDGNYEPMNCRWATQSEQLRNRRSWTWQSDDRDRMGVIQKAIQIQKLRSFKGVADESSSGGSLAPDALRIAAANQKLDITRKRFGYLDLHGPIRDSLHEMEKSTESPSAKIFDCYGSNSVEEQASFVWLLSHLTESEMELVMDRMDDGKIGSLDDPDLEGIRAKLAPILGV